jgi:hypothetical protein
MGKGLDSQNLDLAFASLAVRLEENQAPPVEIVVCGGSALIATGLVTRTTQDVDVVALLRDGELSSPSPLPEALLQAAAEVAEDLGLDHNWLNNGPSRGEGGLFQLGLPQGLERRLLSRRFGSKLTVHLVHRVDQIHFKLYAGVDRGGYHLEDLRALHPSSEELESAARWAMSHDVSEGFAGVLKGLLRKLGHGDVADRL